MVWGVERGGSGDGARKYDLSGAHYGGECALSFFCSIYTGNRLFIEFKIQKKDRAISSGRHPAATVHRDEFYSVPFGPGEEDANKSQQPSHP
jgi:hypothetical protein